MKSFKLITSAALAIGLSFAAVADDHMSQSPKILSNNFTSVGYITTDADGIDFDGLTFEFSHQWSNDVYASFQYAKRDAEYMGVEADTYTLNGVVGKQFAIDAVSLWEIEAGARFYGVEVANVSDDETFFTVAANYRRAITEQFAASAGLDYVDGTTSFVVGAEYDFTSQFGVSFDYAKNSDDDTIMVEFVYRPGM